CSASGITCIFAKAGRKKSAPMRLTPLQRYHPRAERIYAKSVSIPSGAIDRLLASSGRSASALADRGRPLVVATAHAACRLHYLGKVPSPRILDRWLNHGHTHHG